MIGQTLGSYQIVDKLGEGGMGEVYRARDTKLNRDVALKVLPPHVADDPDRLARFRREAHVLASLNHPNIAQIHGFEDPSTSSGQARPAALVMELVPGPTLADRIAHGPVPLAESIAIARQIIDALEAAHDKGVVHRDLKPANIKVTDDGVVKVLDFGLAKAGDPALDGGADPSASPTLTARATQLGVILGTAAYMAPEQAKGRAVDKRADIWAFGVVLYEMLSGQRAFKGEDASDVLAAVLRQEMDWSALPKSTPPNIRRLLQRCLDRDPKKRLRDIGDALFDLDAPVEAPPPVVVAQAPKRGGLAVALPWAAAVVIAGGAIAWAMLRAPEAPAQLITRSATVLKDSALLLNLSADGTKLAYNTVSNGAAVIALRMMDQFDAKIVPGTNGGAMPLLSPDGQWIAYNTLDSTRRIRKVPITGGASVLVCDGDLFGGGAWTADDNIIFAGPKGLLRVPSGGGTPETLTTLDAAKGERAHLRPQPLPGGKQILFTVGDKTGGVSFAVLDPASHQYKVVAKGGINGRYVASGHLTFVREGTLFAMTFDPGTLRAGSEVPLIEGISMNGPEGTGDYAVSDAGLLVYVGTDSAAGGTTLGWTDRKGATQPLSGQSQQRWGTGRLSPDGKRVANGVTAGKDNVMNLVVFDVDRGTATQLTFTGNTDYPIWTHDGRHLIYRGVEGTKPGIYRVAADGSGKPEKLIDTETMTRPTSISADGKTLLFDYALKGQPGRVYMLTIDPIGEPKPLHDTQAAEWNGQVSPDGRWVSYESNESGTRELYVQSFPAPGAKNRVSTKGGANARWARDGRALDFWGGVPTTLFLEAVIETTPALKISAPQELFQVLSGTTWDVTPDKNKFLTEITTASAGSRLATVTNWFDELRRRVPVKK